MLVDYHIHAVAHGEYKYEAEWLAEFLASAHKKGINEIGFCEHDEFSSWINLKAISQAQYKYEDVLIRLGLEADFIPGRETDIKKVAAGNDYDYITGSIHYINGWGFDHPDYKDKFEQYDIDQVYGDYFALVVKMAQSSLFDVVGHLDLVKIWGHRPRRRSTLSYVEPVLKVIKAAGMVVEINSSGLRKPVREIYPGEDIINKMFNLNIPVTFGSDAHHPDQVGEDLQLIRDLVLKVGYKTVVTFNRRRKVPVLL